MLRIVVAAPPAVRRPEDLARLPACADAIELRLDVLDVERSEEGLRRWVEAAPRPVMATMRSGGQGGSFHGAPAEAARTLSLAAHAGAAWIDVEHDVAPLLGELPASAQVVASYHGADDVHLVFEIGGQAVDHHKVARPVDDAATLERARREARAAAGHGRITFVPYGPLGALRGACQHANSLLYGSAAPEVAVVPGQPTLLELLDELRAGEVDVAADLFGLLGRPPTRSPSPAMHNAAFRALDLPAVYLPLPGLDVSMALDMPFRGLSVTTPFKAAALALADESTEEARRMGAANTLVRTDDGRWRASNTDAEAIAEAVPRARAAKGAFVYGAGGYARAALYALGARGYHVRLGARAEDQEAARRLATHFDVPLAGTTWEREADDLVILNATPTGLDGDVPPFLRPGATGAPAALEGLEVLDAPYRRDGTPTGLQAHAEATHAARFVGGLELLRLQAEGQVRAFTGDEVPRIVLDLALFPPPPLLLMGLRGAGKSAVGRRVARRLGRPFLDLDDEVTRVTGRTPAAWIREFGEPAFREQEARVVRRLAGRRGIVVASGGGVLEHPDARAVVDEVAFAVWLRVDPTIAAGRVAKDDADRPRLADAPDGVTEARRLLDRRRAAWEATADVVIDASGEVESVTEAVVSAWCDAAGEGS